MKSAWEKALEKLDDAGIDRPDPSNLSDELRGQLSEVRKKAEARLAELQIMHTKNLTTADSSEYQEIEKNYQVDRERIEFRRDRDVKKLRS